MHGLCVKRRYGGASDSRRCASRCRGPGCGGCRGSLRQRGCCRHHRTQALQRWGLRLQQARRRRHKWLARSQICRFQNRWGNGGRRRRKRRFALENDNCLGRRHLGRWGLERRHLRRGLGGETILAAGRDLNGRLAGRPLKRWRGVIRLSGLRFRRRWSRLCNGRRGADHRRDHNPDSYRQGRQVLRREGLDPAPWRSPRREA